jgi:translation initiation factor 6 (eIF-6)
MHIVQQSGQLSLGVKPVLVALHFQMHAHHTNLDGGDTTGPELNRIEDALGLI